MNSIFSGSASDFTVTLVELAATWWLQSTVLLTVGLSFAACLQRRGPAFQSVVYRVTLCAVLLCPIVTQVLAISGVSLLTIDLRSQYTVETDPPDPAINAAPVFYADSAEVAVPISAVYSQSAAPPLTPDAFATQQQQFEEADLEIASSAEAVPLSEVQTELAPGSDLRQGKALSWSSILAQAFPFLVVVLAGWAVGTVWFVGRVLFDWCRTDSLRRSSQPGELLAEEVCRDVATRLGVPSPRVLSTPFLNSPCLLGHWRPAVLVPEETEPSTYHQVFLHELAHLQRADWLWNLIGRITHALLWFQPLVWLLVRRSAAVAEDVCDDYVLEHGCNREGYVSQLLEIAERSVPQPAIAGVSMVGFRSKLGRRAQRILDTTRVLSTHASRRFACLAFTVTLALTISVGSVYLASPRPADAEDLADSTISTEAEEPIQDDDLVTVSGVVLGPSGKPVDDANVNFVNWLLKENDEHVPLSETKTNNEGHFQLSFRKSQIDRNIGQNAQWKNTNLVVQKPGFGPDAISYRKIKDPAAVTFRLPMDDLPIEGQIVDLEGQPVADATVKVLSIAVPKTDLSGWIEAVENGEDLYHSYSQHLDRSFPAVDNPKVKTDKDGRFRLDNIGRDRVVSLTVQGPTITYSNIRVMTRIHDPITRETGTYFPTKEITYGAKFRRTAAPTQVIRGVVRDAETKQPLPGVRVESWMFAGTRLVSNRVLRTESDSKGEFELAGMPKGEGNVILANPKDGQPYLMREIQIPNKAGLGAVDVEVELHRGVVIRGRITDKDTGEPVIARLHYLPFLENDFAAAVPEFDENENTNGFQSRYESKPDGTYELIGLPGRAIVGVQSVGQTYRRGVGSEKIEGANEHGHFKTYNNPIMASTKWPNTLVEINPPADAKTHDLDVELDPGNSVTILVVDEQGKPVTGVTTNGLASGYEGEQSVPNLEVVALSPNENRTLILHHRERNIGQVVRIGGTDAPRKVTLESCVTVKGQLLDTDGEPLVGVGLRIDVLPSGDFGKRLPPISTDREGRFEGTLIPGTKYAISAQGPKIQFKSVIRELEIKAGEVKDLGPMKLGEKGFERMANEGGTEPDTAATSRPDTSTGETTRPAKSRLVAVNQPVSTKSAASKPANNNVAVQGQVVDPAGAAVADATVLVVSEKLNVATHAKREIVSRTKSDKAGRFLLSVAKPTYLDNPNMHGSLNVVVTKVGWGTGWSKIGVEQTKTGRVHVRLLEEKKITGRLVNLEGQPLGGIQVAVTGLVAAKEGTDLDSWHAKAARNPSAMKQSHYLMASSLGDNRPAYVRFPGTKGLTLNGIEALPRTVTKGDGTFVVRSVARDHNATLAITGKGIAKTLINVVAREMKTVNMPTPDSRFGTQKLYGANFDYAAHPSRLIRGTVVDKQTKKPLVGVQIEAKHTIHNTLGTVVVSTDDQGHFEIPNLPAKDGLQLSVKADHSPYFRPDRIEVPKSPGPAPVEVIIELERGEWIRGRLTDKMTGKPIDDGWVSYYPFHTNKNAEKFSHFRLDMMTVGYGDRVPINPDGTYRIVGIPGRGVVLCGATDAGIYKHGVGADTIEGLYGKKGAPRPRVYHLASVMLGNSVAEARVKPSAGATCDIELEPLDRRSFRVVDPQGNPISDYCVTGLLPSAMNVANPNLADAPIRSDAKFEVYGLANKVPRTLLLRHDEKKLGIATIVGGNSTDSNHVAKGQAAALELLPTGSISGKVLAADGKPAAGAVVHLSYKVKRAAGLFSKQKLRDSQQYLGGTDVLVDGSFRFEAIPSGIPYQLDIQSSDQTHKVSAETSTVSAGENVAVGELTLTPKPAPQGRFQ